MSMATSAATRGKGSEGAPAGLGIRKVTLVDPCRHASTVLSNPSSNPRPDRPENPLLILQVSWELHFDEIRDEGICARYECALL